MWALKFFSTKVKNIFLEVVCRDTQLAALTYILNYESGAISDDWKKKNTILQFVFKIRFMSAYLLKVK